MANGLGGMILENPALVGQVAQSLGLDPSTARAGMEALLPGLTRGIERNAAQPGGLEALLGALKSGGHQRYVEDPSTLAQSATRDAGNAILGHILGRKEVSRNVASHASQQSGVDSQLLKQMLPILATAVMGALSKQTEGGSSAAQLAPEQRGGTPLDGLASFLDANQDGSMIDDVLNLAQKFF